MAHPTQFPVTSANTPYTSSQQQNFQKFLPALLIITAVGFLLVMGLMLSLKAPSTLVERMHTSAITAAVSGIAGGFGFTFLGAGIVLLKANLQASS